MATAAQPEFRTPPHNLDAEKAVLGTFYINNDAVADVMAVLSPDDFYDPRHQEIYRVVLELAEDKKPIDPVVLINEFERRNLLERVGGASYLTGLEAHVISPGNVMHHAEIVHEKSLLRRLIRATAEISDDAYTERQEAEALLSDAEQKVFEIIKGRRINDFFSFGEVAQEVWNDILHRSENRQEVTGVTTGYPRLDKMTGGLQRSDLLILAARPSMGKTSLALNIVLNAAEKARTTPTGETYLPGIGVFSLEMSRQQVIQRMICGKAAIPMDLLRKNMMSRRQVEQFLAVSEQMQDLPIYVADTPSLDPMELRLQAQQMQIRDPNLSLIVIDYLQLMTIKKKRTDSRQQEVSEISRSLKALARDLNVPVLALSQLSRNIENRRGAEQEPKLSDLRESGAIEQDADVVMFIHREKRTDRTADDAGKPAISRAELIIGKQRNGPIGKVAMLFREDFTRFEEMAPEYQ